MKLNHHALELCGRLVAAAERLRVAVSHTPDGTRIIDCGVGARGGLEAGRRLAEISMAGLGEVSLAGVGEGPWHQPAVAVRSDQPVVACMASQYAGWRVAAGDFFGMGSGPMRALAGKEKLLASLGIRETEPVAVGVLEAPRIPDAAVCRQLAADCAVEPAALTLLVARTASQAGTVQVVARSVETALHKLFELGFDLSRVESAWGLSPLPPVAANDLEAIGRTNDAILYGARVTLWLRGDDASLEAVGPQLPSLASRDYGQPFARLFERYDRDFYRIDPQLFAPAVIQLRNLDSGNAFSFGRLAPELLDQSFA